MDIEWKMISLSEVNKRKLPITVIDPCNDLDKANKILKWCADNCLNAKFKMTNNGGISHSMTNARNIWQMSCYNNVYEILVHHRDYGWARIQFRNITTVTKDGDTNTIHGLNALKELLNKIPTLKNYINLDENENEKWHNRAKTFYNMELYGDYAFLGIPEDAQRFNGVELEHVWSLDIHSAFPAALTRKYPETAPVIEDLFQKRKEDPMAKAIMNYAIGAMTSEGTKSRGLKAKRALAKVRYDVLEDNMLRIQYLAHLIRKQGGIILNFKTDSIKFIWDRPYDPELPFQGTGLGEWSYDFIDCKYRQFSTSKYEYIDNAGIYHPVISGKTKLDRVKPRSEWKWGDIVNNEAVVLGWRYNALKNKFEMEEI